MNKIKHILTVIACALVITATSSALSFAAPEGDFGPGGGGDGTSSNGCTNLTTIIKCDNTGGNPIISMLLQVINFLAVGVGIAVVGGIIWGGMLYASSNGDSSKTKQGISVIVNAVIGLLLFIFMYALINFLVPGGLFT